jgi:hypothetical protein
MKILLSVLFATLLATQPLFAHGDHHEMEMDDVGGVAKTHIDQLVTNAKLPASWSTVSAVPASSDNRMVGGKKRWVLTFENPKETDGAKKKLEIVLTPEGKFVSHKFTK